MSSSISTTNFSKLLLTVSASFLIFISFYNVAHAGFLIQRPLYIGLGTGLVGNWSFDGQDMSGNTAFDRSGQGNNGTLTNGPKRAIGKIGQALDFDGNATADDYVNAGSASLLDDLGPVTFASWVYMHGMGGLSDARWFDKRSDAAGTLGISSELGAGAAAQLPSLRVKYSTTILLVYPASGLISINTWTHITITWDGSSDANQVHIYVNGVESPSYPTRQSGVGTRVSDASENMTLGNANAAGFARAVDGIIDEFRIYNRALSADEIKRLYRIGATMKIGLKNIGGRATATSTVNVSPKTAPSAGLVGSWSFDGPDMAGTTAYDRSGQGKNGSSLGQDISSSGLVGWWKLDEGSGSSPADSSRGGNTGSFNSVPTWVTGKIGSNALNLDGVDDSVTLTSLDLGTVHTISGWVKYDTNNSGDTVIGSDNNNFTLEANTVNTLLRYRSGDATADKSANFVRNTGQWYHLAVTRDDATVNFYIDGALTSDSPFTLGAGRTSLTLTRIGERGIDTTGWLAGSLDDVRVYNRALSAAEVAQLYTYGLPKFAPAIGKIGQAIDSTLSYVNPGNVSSSVQSFTFWMKTASSSPTVNLLDLNASQYINIVGGTVKANNITSPSIFVDGVSASTVNAGWHHIAVTTGTAVNASATNLGLNATTTAPLDGALDDVRFYNRVINGDEIKRLYNLGR